MKTDKKLPSIPYLIVFIASLLVGYRTGSGFSIPDLAEKQSKVSPPTQSRPLEVLANGQRSILFVLVDEIQSSSPRLESVWVILYMPGDPRLTLMPIFPSATGNSPRVEEELLASFKIQWKGGAPAIHMDFLKALESMDFWWSGSVLLDEQALSQIIASVEAQGRPAIWTRLFNGTQPEKENAPIFPARRDDKQAALLDQVNFYQELCWNAVKGASSGEDSEGFDILELMPDHLIIDFDFDQLKAELQDLRGHGSSLYCEFPVLSVQTLATW